MELIIDRPSPSAVAFVVKNDSRDDLPGTTGTGI